MLGSHFIARPDGAKDHMVYKWPDVNVPMFSTITVEPDEIAVFLKQGDYVGQLPSGQHRLDGAQIPFIGGLINSVTGGRTLLSEIYFVSQREFSGLRFGGSVDNVVEPQTRLVIGLRVHGEFALRCVDARALLVRLVGTGTRAADETIDEWSRQQLLKALRVDVIRRIAKGDWPVIGLAAYIDEIEAVTISHARNYLGPYGLEVTQLGDFLIDVNPPDEKTLKRLVELQVQTASLGQGDFSRLAAGQALLGAAEGMAHGDAATQIPGMILGAGLGTALGQQAAASNVAAQGRVVPPAALGGSACMVCGAVIPPGSRFCPGCAAPQIQALPPAAIECRSCHRNLISDARFCPDCGADQRQSQS